MPGDQCRGHEGGRRSHGAAGVDRRAARCRLRALEDVAGPLGRLPEPVARLALAERWAGKTCTPRQAGVTGEEGKKGDAGVGGLSPWWPPPTMTPEPSLASPDGDTAGLILPEEPRGGERVSCTDVPKGFLEECL